MQVLLMDELTTFLDYEDQRNVLQCVRSIVRGELPAADPTGGGSGSGSGSDWGEQGSLEQEGESNGLGASSSSELEAGGGSGGGSTPPGGSRVTALWVTHRLEELEYADAVSYMEAGRVVFSGSPQEVRDFLRNLGAHV